MFAMIPELKGHSAYQIMFTLGLIDLINLSVSGIASGLFSINGIVFCHYPRLIFVLGSIGNSFWLGCVYGVSLLSINRSIDLLSPHYSKVIFGGNRTWFLLSISIVIILFTMLGTPPVLFSSYLTAWSFDPYFNYAESNKHFYESVFHSVTNVIACVSTVTLNALVIIIFMWRISQRSSNSSGTSRVLGIRLLLQSVFMATITFIGSAGYVIMQYVPVPF
uniref:7TM_GPCR_Srx domain-containing protein n=1 Tax=Rhabditophanes sp. KR3021 TaxID=114890 RepID=A0AC35UD56_9BILA